MPTSLASRAKDKRAESSRKDETSDSISADEEEDSKSQNRKKSKTKKQKQKCLICKQTSGNKNLTYCPETECGSFLAHTKCVEKKVRNGTIQMECPNCENNFKISPEASSTQLQINSLFKMCIMFVGLSFGPHVLVSQGKFILAFDDAVSYSNQSMQERFVSSWGIVILIWICFKMIEFVWTKIFYRIGNFFVWLWSFANAKQEIQVFGKKQLSFQKVRT